MGDVRYFSYPMRNQLNDKTTFALSASNYMFLTIFFSLTNYIVYCSYMECYQKLLFVWSQAIYSKLPAA